MKFEEYIKKELLRSFIKAYRIIEGRDELVNRVVTGTLMISFFEKSFEV